MCPRITEQIQIFQRCLAVMHFQRYKSTLDSLKSVFNGLCINYLVGVGGEGWEMVEICPKTKSYPPLIKQKLILTPPHIMIILRLTPPPSKEIECSLFYSNSRKLLSLFCRQPRQITMKPRAFQENRVMSQDFMYQN